MLALLRHRNYALLWCASIVSLTGDFALVAALPIYVYVRTGSVSVTAGILIAQTVPRIFVNPLAGVLVDRVDRRRVMIVANVLLAGAVSLLLLVRSPSTTWILYLATFLLASIECALPPAVSSLLPTLVPGDELPRAISMSAITTNLAQLVGPMIGVTIAARWGLPGLVVLDGGSFLIAAVLIGLIRSQAEPPATVVRSVGRSMRDGVRAIAANPTLRIIFAGMSAISIGDGIFSVLYPVFLVQVLHGSTEAGGVLLTAIAAGAVLGGLIIAVVGKRVLFRRIIAIGCLAQVGTLLARLYAPRVTPSFAVEIALFALAGFIGIFALTAAHTLVLVESPAEYRGRIRGILGVATFALGAIGMKLSSLLVTRLGVENTMAIDAAAYALAGMILWTLPADAPPSSAP